MSPGVGAGLAVLITVSGQSCTGRFSYQAPTITNITQSMTTGQTVTVTGTGFGTDSTVISATFNGVACSSIFVTTPFTTFTCLAPAGTGNCTVNITVPGQTTLTTFAYQSPVVTGATPAPTSGGLVNITGTNFGSNPSLITVTANGQNCANVVVLVPSLLISCNATSGVGANLALQVTVDGLVGQSSHTALLQ